MLRMLLYLVMFGAGSVYAQQFSARVGIQSESDVIALYRQGVQIADARVEERSGPDGSTLYHSSYCPENGFVTVIASTQEIEMLRQLGDNISNVQLLNENVPAPASVQLDTLSYQFGWPRTIFNGNSLYENSPTVADMDGNGQLDLSVTNAWGFFNPTVPPYLIVWRRNGAYLAGFPVELEPGVLQSSADAGISAMGDVFGDSKLEILCGDENGYLYAYNYDGTPLNGFPVSYGYGMGVFTPALADVDHDGKCEVAVISHQWSSPYGNANLHLLKVTSTGAQEMPGYPINIERGASNSPAIGDLDGDGEMEIVVCTGGASDSSVLARVIAFTPSGQTKAGFPWVVGRNSAGCSPTLYDINQDGTLEILVRVKPDYNQINGIYAIDYHGTILPGFPFPITYGNPDACVAVGDMDGDGIPELAYGGVEAVDSGKVWAFNLSGELLPGFPARVYRTWVDGSVAIADLDGDHRGDVVCGTNGVSNKPGLIRAFNYLGQEINGFPLSPGNPLLNSFTTHPTVVDIDGDGDTEVFAGRLDKNVYGWDSPGIYDSAHAWTTFKGNAARTGGQVRSPFIVGVKENSNRPVAFSLEQNYPNPFNPATTIDYQLGEEGNVTLRVFDVLGREVATLIDDVKSQGRHAAVWDAGSAASGIYYCRLNAGGAIRTIRMVLMK